MKISNFNVYKERINLFIQKIIDSNFCDGSTNLHEAIKYVTYSGGKRIRATLMYLVAQALQVDMSKIDYVAAALEIIHCYSLVHDDLPAMDDDILRRGISTCHIKFDEATAILVGDSLNTFAFQVLTMNDKVNNSTKIKLIEALAKASGANGMILGQSIDMQDDKAISLEALRKVHRYKTGYLIKFAIDAVIIIASEENHLDTNIIQTLQKFADNLGLAFQVQDDVLEAESTTSALGKPVDSDKKNNKSTFVSLLGLKEAKKLQRRLYLQAEENIKLLPDYGSAELRKIIGELNNREY